MNTAQIKQLTWACYSANVTMSVVGNVSPVLFLTFRQLYGLSYSLLGLLVVINFVTQLIVDLIFSFFSHKFNIPRAVKTIPIIATVGMILYACAPWLFPNNVYLGLAIGTVIFSAASGFAEVLISPVIAALPSDDPEREMSKLHAVYAWGVVGVIAVSTLFLYAAGGEQWQWLMLFLTLLPIGSTVLFAGAVIPPMKTPEKVSGALKLLRNKTVWLCVFAIFLGGSAECTMAQWASGYIEGALGIEKVWGDVFGVAMFAFTLGLGRSLYAKIGKNLGRTLTFGAVGATACYLVAALLNVPVLGLIACGFTGFCVSMMWPGMLLVASNRVVQGGVFIYALMAAGGDLGVSVGPQLVGIVADATIANPAAAQWAAAWNVTTEQLGMKLGMLTGALFPLIGIAIYAYIWKTQKHTD